MSRRDFVQLALAAGVSSTVALGAYSNAMAAEPKKGGHFRLGQSSGSSNDTLDPATWASGFAGVIGIGIIGDALVDIDASNNAVPALAESFEATNADASEWAFKLRKGVEFSNGRSLKPKDVLASYHHHMGENSKSGVRSTLADIRQIRIDGDDTVVFELEQGNADFPYITSDYRLPILQAEDDGTLDWSSGVGTGAFSLEHFEPGVRLEARRNPNYWRDAWFESVEMLAIHDVVARTAALKTGDVDYITNLDLKTLNLLKRDAALAITNVTGFAFYVAPMDVRVSPFDNNDARLALKYAVDREELVEKILRGYGKVGNDNPIAPSIKYAIQPEPVHGYDPDRARYHLKKAGLSSMRVDLSASDAAFPGAVDAAILMQSSAKKCGIDINVIREAADGYWSNVWMKKPWCMSYFRGRPTIDWMMSMVYYSKAAWNDTFWENTRFDDLLGKARVETNEARRGEMYAEIQQILHDEGGANVLMFNDYVSGHSAKLAHGALNSNLDLDGGYIFRKWWYA
ncbi:peptide ABC transporter substrate-binding protein [Nitratireductor sp. StC3]|nr:peptide ABC transporter substrate-binding protein [Nitratireductor sp. StC3]